MDWCYEQRDPLKSGVFSNYRVLLDLYSLKGASKILFLQMGLNVPCQIKGVYMWTFRIEKKRKRKYKCTFVQEKKEE